MLTSSIVEVQVPQSDEKASSTWTEFAIEPSKAKNIYIPATSPQSPPPPQQIQNPFVEVRPTPSKGLGVFARIPIPAGTRIISEAPLLSLPPNYTPSDIDAAFSLLSPTQQHQFLSLSHPSTSSPRQSRVASIFQANCFSHTATSSTTGDEALTAAAAAAGPAAAGPAEAGGGGAILCPGLLSRVNHSCVPNAVFAWNERLRMQTVHVFRDVDAGEEVEISYLRHFGRREKRRGELGRWGFWCKCTVCGGGGDGGADGGGLVRESERQRERMEELAVRIGVFESCAAIGREEYGVGGPMEFILEVVELLKAEGLGHRALAEMYHRAAVWTRKRGDVEGAREWARREIEVEMVCVGRDSDGVGRAERFLERLHLRRWEDWN